MKIISILFIFLVFSSCEHGFIGSRSTSYVEIPSQTLDQSLAKSLPTGYTATILSGPTEKLSLKGSGIEFGLFEKKNNFELEFLYFFQSYPNIDYRITISNGSSTSTSNYSFSTLASGFDLNVGYYLFKNMKIYTGVRSQAFTVYTINIYPSVSTYSATTRNIYALAGLGFYLPFLSTKAFALKVNYSSSLLKDSSTKSANEFVGEVAYLWGL